MVGVPGALGFPIFLVSIKRMSSPEGRIWTTGIRLISSLDTWSVAMKEVSNRQAIMILARDDMTSITVDSRLKYGKGRYFVALPSSSQYRHYYATTCWF